MPPTILVLQHIAQETLGSIADLLDARGLTYQYIRTFAGQPVPENLADFAGLIVMGGPMGVYEQERYPHLADEIRLISEAIRADKPVLGICLGSQLLAAALHAPVTPGPAKEIGWYTLSLSPEAAADPLFAAAPSPFTAFVWHGDIFDLPAGAVPLASSAMTRYQAFRYGRATYGLLFHLEVTAEMIRDMVATFHDELTAAGIDGAQIVARIGTDLPALETIGREVFERWAELVKRDA